MSMHDDMDVVPGGIDDRIRAIVSVHSGLGEAAATMAANADLWNAGMQSVAGVRVMVAVEEAFGVELPDELLTRETFSSIESLAKAIRTVLVSAEQSR